MHDFSVGTGLLLTSCFRRLSSRFQTNIIPGTNITQYDLYVLA